MTGLIEGFSSGQWTAFWAGVTALATVAIAVGAIMFGIAELKMAQARDRDLQLRRDADEARSDREKRDVLLGQATMVRGRYTGYRTSQHRDDHVWTFTNLGDLAWPESVLFFAYDGEAHDSGRWEALLDEAASRMGVQPPVAARDLGPVPSGGALEREVVLSGPFFPRAGVLMLATATGERLWVSVDTSRALELRPPRG